jgi:SAM-dependent methyltransferase
VTRALRALSIAYVQQRHKVSSGATLDTAGKRAAFALFYAPLHFIATHLVISALGADEPSPRTILDIGCGTGAAGAVWAIAAGGGASLLGIDRHRWAIDETRWSYRQLGLAGRARLSDVSRLPRMRPGNAVVAAYVLNELSDRSRRQVEDQLMEAAGRGVRVLVLEPIARGITPWWNEAAARVKAAGGRADDWRFQVELPEMLKLFDKAAGLNHEELTVRSLFMGGSD